MNQSPHEPDESKTPDERKEPEEKEKEQEQEIVITPAGPMPKNRVHHVGPGQVVRRNEDGTYSVVPRE